MTRVISWIAAQAESDDVPGSLLSRKRQMRENSANRSIDKLSVQHLPAHRFPSPVPGKTDPSSAAPSHEDPPLEDPSHAALVEEDAQVVPPEADGALVASDSANESGQTENAAVPFEDDPLDRDPELRTYRGRTLSLLRLYLRYSLETGRLPSVMGSEFFRSRVTCYSVTTFEDRVVFVHDMEICLEKMHAFSRQIIGRNVIQGHSLWQTARLLGCNEKTIRRYVPIARDELSEILLKVGLLRRRDSETKKSCQGGKNDDFPASDCEEGKYIF
jgi:hypothetical protein